MIALLLIFFAAFTKLTAQQHDFDRPTFYKVLAADNVADIDVQITSVQKSSVAEKAAYEGVLLMKKSGLVPKAKDKLHFFKEGRIKLEAAIAADKNNTEYRFLRVIIQEHAPKIVKYRNNLDGDCKMIQDNFNTLSSSLQQVITDYSRNSKSLKLPSHN